MIELEKTYLARYIPVGLELCRKKQIIDRYMPISDKHPGLRLRKNGQKCELTKKRPLVEGDASAQVEQTIVLISEEYDILATLPAKQISKTRYYLERDTVTYEIDIFEEALTGLVLVDAEFATEKEKELFMLPEFCLAEVTQEEFIAGGMICGKSYEDIAPLLGKFGYTPLYID